MAFHFRRMDEASARAVICWRYEPPYDMYNITSPDAEADVRFFADPHNNYYAIANDDGELVAFCCFGTEARVPGGDYSQPALDLGLGVRPDLTGQGRGAMFAVALTDFAQRTFDPKVLRVSVAEFNLRALRVWRQLGFTPVQQFARRDGILFVVLTREAAFV